ncbi:MAG TPA: hypothetical protein VIV15_07855, partial [Anaerolineales bacterium]
GPRPCGGGGPVEAIKFHLAEVALVDMHADSRAAGAVGGQRVELAGASIGAIAGRDLGPRIIQSVKAMCFFLPRGVASSLVDHATTGMLQTIELVPVGWESAENLAAAMGEEAPEPAGTAATAIAIAKPFTSDRPIGPCHAALPCMASN